MDFNFPQHLLPLLLLNTAFFGFFQYIDRVYKDAFQEVNEKVRNSDFNSNDNTNESMIYKEIKSLYEKLTNENKIINTDLTMAFIYVYIGLMVIYFFYFMSCLSNYHNELNIFWIISLSLCILGLGIILDYTRKRTKKMIDHVDNLRHRKKEFLDLLNAYLSDEKRRRKA